MRILNIIQCTNLGGMEWASFRLMSELIDKGHECSLLSLNRMGPLKAILEDHKITYHSLDYGNDNKIKTYFKLRKFVKGSNYDAIVMTGHNFIASLVLLGTPCSRKIGAMHFHHEGVLPYWKWKLIYLINNLTFDIITFPSDYVRAEAVRINNKIDSKAFTLRNPLKIPAHSISERDVSNFLTQHGIPVGAFVVGNAGWLIQRKRFDVFLETAKYVIEINSNVHFIIAGDGELRASIISHAIELGIDKNIHFIGWVADLSLFYSAINVLLFNSDWDCFPTTPIEAMSYAKPVVASIEHGGLSEILDNNNGWITNKHDPRILSEYVIEALGNQGSIRGVRARKSVISMCSPSLVASQFESYLFGE